MHADTENATFYRALRQFYLTKENIEHAEEEHDEVKTLLSALGNHPIDSDQWMEQFGELKHAVSHHVQEEENEIFAKAKTLLSQDQANQLAAEMAALKQNQLEPV